jgi:Glycosyl hydrolases family 16
MACYAHTDIRAIFSGEIDIIESVATAAYSGVCGSYRHSHNYTCCCGENVQIPPGDCYPEPWQPQINYTAAYHTFAVEWNATALVFSVDGNAYHTRTVEQSPIPETPMYWIFDTAVPNFWPPGKHSLYPVFHIIDRVRVYQKSGYGLGST